MSQPITVPAPDPEAAAASAERRSPLGPQALGVLADRVDQLAALGHLPVGPVTPQQTRLVVFAADHGVAIARSATADLPAASSRRAKEFAAGEGPGGSLASLIGIPVTVIDVGLSTIQTPDGESSDRVRPAAVRPGSGLIDVEDALTLNDVALAIQAGRTEAAEQIRDGADLLIGAVCGVGAGLVAAGLASHLTGVEPVDATGRGTGVDDSAWARRCAVVRDARYRLDSGSPDAATLLRTAGGSDLAALTGFILEAALSGIPVLVDDVPGAVAAVLAHRFAPGAERYVLIPAVLAGTVHARLLGLLDVEPMLSAPLSGGIAVAALMAAQLLRMACTVADTAPMTDYPDRAAWSVSNWNAEQL